MSDLNAVLPEMWRQYVEGLLKSFGDHFSSAVGIGSKMFIYLLKLYKSLLSGFRGMNFCIISGIFTKSPGFEIFDFWNFYSRDTGFLVMS